VTHSYQYDLAISAVPYDVALVSDLLAHFALRLDARATWAGNGGPPSEVPIDVPSPLHAEASRVAVLLYQRLWSHDTTTRLDDVALRERLLRRPGSVRVVLLDDHALPRWLEDVPHCDLTTEGVEGVGEFLGVAIAASGGSLRRTSPPVDSTPETVRMWPGPPPQFLAQQRALVTLRRELDALATELKPAGPAKGANHADKAVELHELPNRLVLRLETVGVSFSWVAGGLGTVADGRLLVIQWEGVAVAPRTRGVAALKFATPVRERVYHVESSGPDDWHWRADGPNGRASSTQNLAGEWLAGAFLAMGEDLATRSRR
jgi:hypothetical protein